MSGYVGDGPGVGPSRLRFLVFGLAVVIGAGALSARLFALQVGGGTTQYTTFAATNRNVLELIPSTRGMVFDRNGSAARDERGVLQRADPAARPARIAPRGGRRDARRPARTWTRPRSTWRSTRTPARATTRFASPRTSIPSSPASSPRPAATCRASRSSSRRSAPTRTRTLFSHILGYTGPISGDEYADMRELGYLPDDLDRPRRRRGDLRGAAPGHVRPPARRARRRPGGAIQVLSTERQPVAGSSLRLTIDTKVQEEAEKALHWGMKAANLKRARDHRHEPAERRDPGDGQRADVRQQPVLAAASTRATYKKLLNDPQKPLVNHAISDQYPPGSTYKLVAGTGVLADGKITPQTQIRTAGLPDPRRLPLPRLERRRLRDVQHLLRLRPLERHVLLPGRRDARHRPARLLGASSTASAGRRASTFRPRSAASSRRTSGRSTSTACRSTRARSTSRASARAMTPSRRCSS